MSAPTRMLALLSLALSPSALVAQDIAVRGDLVYTMAGPPIEDGLVLVRDGVIVAIGPASEMAITTDVVVLHAPVVTPGLVDVRSAIGLAGYLNQDHDQEQLEHSSPMQPELRAFDAYDAHDPLIDWVRSMGVTTVHTGHAPGELISGQTMVVKTRGETIDQAVLMPQAMVAATLGEGAQRQGSPPGTRGKTVALLRERLIRAQEYVARRARAAEEERPAPARDLGLETLAQVLSGELPLCVEAHRSRDIEAALRLRDEFGFELVLSGASEVYTLLDEVRAADVPVLLHATMARTRGEREHLAMDTAARLAEAGLPFAIQSGYESYVPKTRVVLFEAAVAARFGLAFEDALAAVTIDAARILGLEERIGSLALGKDGDLALYDGDPFEPTNHCVGVVIDGVRIEGETR